MDSTDPTRSSRIRPVYDLLRRMDAGIAELYARHDIGNLKPRFSIALIRLGRLGPMPIKDLAAEAGVTHSAMSQTVSSMIRESWVETTPGPDARTRTVHLTPAGAAMVPFLEAEWIATEAALAELDAEIPYPLEQVVRDLEAALERRPFADRLAANLDVQLSRTEDADGRV